ncbi:MAG: helix-turn-helix domain-containing protein, partial [Phaeodactylibacter sp.]|nr:helix-turn-helix domain-containing protein [Phaeodactylibacter sp.]
HFMRQVRLQEGYKLLKEGGLNVSEVAYRVGYKDPGYFSKLFAEMYGRPPSEV